jgi:hypothetical protein
MRRLALGVAMLAATVSLAGCPATHGEYPTLACKIDKDCYLGEVCTNDICRPVIPPDMSVGDMVFPYDFTTDDMGPTSTDAGDDM